MRLYPKSSNMIDDLGNSYHARWVSLGSDEKVSTWAHQTLFANIPKKAILHFVGVSSQAKMIAILSVAFYRWSDPEGSIPTKFSNISFTEE